MIENATEFDIKDIYILFKRVYTINYSLFLKEKREIENRILNLPNIIDIKNGKCIRKNGNIIAYIQYTKESNYILVSELKVDPDYQNRGYGSFLLYFIENEIDNQDEIRILIHPRNKRAIDFYEKNGYEYDCEGIMMIKYL